MKSLEDILKLAPTEFEVPHRWWTIDGILNALPTLQQQLDAWQKILDHLASADVPHGHPLFRIGTRSLVLLEDECIGIGYLERAVQHDKRFKPEEYNRMAAYRVLTLVKGFFEHLRSSRNRWETDLLLPEFREMLAKTLVTVYDLSRTHVLDMKGYTVQTFLGLIRHDRLRLCAAENYFLGERLLTQWSVEDRGGLTVDDEYPLARSIIGLFGGVLEALIRDRLPTASGKSLGPLLSAAHKKSLLRPGQHLAILSSLLLYLRNHMHPERNAARTEYHIDINTAKACKIALDWSISELRKNAQEA